MSGKAIDIVKSSGKRPTESFDRTKLHRSVKAACLSVRSHDGEADNTADKVCDAVIIWLEERPEVTSHDIRRIASKHLTRYHPDAAYIYEHHRYTI
jgi:transcriptional regulator NrdR family protein